MDGELSDVDEPLTIVIGYDGSDAARRGLERVRDLMFRRMIVGFDGTDTGVVA